MAGCLWRYRWRILFCLCTPCILMGCLLTYITLAVCLSITSSTSPAGPPEDPRLPPFFVASGASTNSGLLAPYPVKPFWRLKLNKEAHWNLIQHLLDRQHNPILQSRPTGSENSSHPGLEQDFSCIPNYRGIWTMSDYFSLPAQMQRFIISMHCRDYKLLIDQPKLCSKRPKQHGNETAMLLLAIKSQAQNFENRHAIRKTWGRSGLVKGQVGNGGLVHRIFLLGKNDLKADPKMEENLKEEAKKYGDIIMWDFLDTFFNLTLKDVMFWDWFSNNCQETRFVFKGDDDVFVRTPALLDYLQNEEKLHLNRSGPNKTMDDFVVGDIITSAAPLRSETTKYFIPDSFYKGLYPSYAGGGGVVYSGALVLRLVQVSKRVHLFPIDDVYLGMCLQRLGVVPVHHPAFLTFGFPSDEADEPCAHHTILLVHKRSPKEMQKLWPEIMKPSPECKDTPLRDGLLKKKQ